MTKQAPLDINAVLAKCSASVIELYDFSQALYTGALNRITGIVCPAHGETSQYASQLRKGRVCPQCGHDRRGQNRRLTQTQAIAKAIALHNGFYSYEKAIYRIGHDKMTVTCPIHGDFEVLALNHIHGRGRGCSQCGAAKRGRRTDVAGSARRSAATKINKHAAIFLARAHDVHGPRYDYSKMVYKGQRTPLEIVCPDHGSFFQSPGHHIGRKHGCPDCSHHRSKGEAEILTFVSGLVEATSRRRDIIPPRELDIYVPGHALAIEYCGEYWHGSAKAEEETFARTRHLDKTRECEALGIRLLTVFESEWKARPQAIQSLIRNALGQSSASAMARKCEIRTVGPAAARDFFALYHPQGGGGHGQNYGLYVGDELTACMRFAFGINDRGWGAERVWSLSRYATSKNVAGGASRLFKRFLADVDPAVVKSFSDNRYFTGGMYERLGFAMEEALPPEYQVYHIKTGLLPKSSWQRRKIPARIRDIRSTESFDPATDPRSERDMTYLLGARRIFDCGKKRWVWRKPA